MKLRRIACLCLASMMTFSLAACGDKKQPEDPAIRGEIPSGAKTWYFGGDNILSGDIETETLFEGLEDTIDPKKIYSEMEYTEKILRGVYALHHIEEDVKDVRKEIPLAKVEFTKDTYEMVPIPVAVYLGKENVSTIDTAFRYSEFEAITDCEIAMLKFTTADEVGMAIFRYTVEGNKIKFEEINQTSNPGEKFAYEVGKAKFEYEFQLSGPYLTLTNGRDELKLTSYAFTKNENGMMTFTGYSTEKSPLFHGLDYFYTGDSFTYAVKNDGSYFYRSAYKISDDGRITIYLSDKEFGKEEKATIKQFVYVMQSKASLMGNEFSMILYDGKKEYHYTDTITEREARILAEDGASGLTEEQVKQIAEKKQDLYDDLQKEFEANGIQVSINRKTGEIALDASVVFGGDSAKLTADGKALLDQFIDVYTTILGKEEYEGFIKTTKVEGHTAPVAGSTYESGLALSKERAENVKKYCMKIQPDMKLKAEGLSNKKPVYGDDGKVDMAASRRVSFRFIVDIKKDE